MIRRRLVGLMASLAVIAIVIGMPILLLQVGGNPIPNAVPAPAEVWGWLSRPDDGTITLAAIIIVSWLVWGLLTLTLVLETVALVRGVKAPTLPGLPQSFARRLVAASAMLIVSAPPVLGGLAQALADEAPATLVATALPSDRLAQAPAAPTNDIPASPAGLVDHVVQPGDTLSRLAADHLGDPDRWPEIYDASTGVVQPGGERLEDPDLILIGWTLQVPTRATGDTQTSVVVQPGDNLSALAATHLGDPDRWPEIYHASTGVLQPDGRQLTDPDVLEPGWRLNLPSTTVDAAPPAPDEVDPQPEPAAPQTDPAALEADPAAPPPTTEAEPSTEPGEVAPLPADQPGSPAEQPAHDQTSDDTAAEPTFTDPASGLSAPWLLTGVAIGGSVLAGSALMMLRRRREQQFRLRRPGRMIPTPAANLVPVEKTVTAVGSVTAPTVTFMDEALRRLAAHHTRAGIPMPRLAAVEIGDDQLTLHLAAPADLDAPWTAPDDSRLRWTLRAEVDLDL
ncbi:MAG: LysM peptidoglycan-binding domain-containing protein, partial [Propionicimonas sp.]|nr:LysM peptidoglycan-binding domain-containing protein [Propionicimonas sp.]